MPTGSKTFSLTSKFVVMDQGCHVKYTLVHKDTTTELATDGSYPEITLGTGNSQGQIPIIINYSTPVYRVGKERTNPEFEIIAQGH